MAHEDDDGGYVWLDSEADRATENPFASQGKPPLEDAPPPGRSSGQPEIDVAVGPGWEHDARVPRDSLASSLAVDRSSPGGRISRLWLGLGVGVALVLVIGWGAMWWNIQARLDDQAEATDQLAVRLDEFRDAMQRSTVTGLADSDQPWGTPQETARGELPESDRGPVPESGDPSIDIPDAAESRMEIAQAFLRVFSPGTPERLQLESLILEGDTGDLLDQIRTSSCAQESFPAVTSIAFVVPDRATVRFAFQGPAIEALGFERTTELTGSAERFSDGHWLVTRYTLRATVEAITSYCPP